MVILEYGCKYCPVTAITEASVLFHFVYLPFANHVYAPNEWWRGCLTQGLHGNAQLRTHTALRRYAYCHKGFGALHTMHRYFANSLQLWVVGGCEWVCVFLFSFYL